MAAQLRRLVAARKVPFTGILGRLVQVNRGEPDVPASRKEREAFLKAYAAAIQAAPNVVEVRARDKLSCLAVYTAYRGDVRTFEDDIYDVEAATMDRFPTVRVIWHLADADQMDLDSREAPLVASSRG